MATDDHYAHELSRRLGDVESEVRHLQQRVAQLEQAAHGGATAAEASSAAPPQLPPVVAAPQPPRPPPLPVKPRVAGDRGFAADPRPAPPPLRTTSVDKRQPTAIGEFLRAVHLLPPADESRGEVQLGWWATRIGALLLVLGVVFSGVYLSLHTPPWVRLLELAATSFVVVVGGWWLEKKVARVGAVVFGAGLALVFFTAFAAYAVPAVKVFDNIAVAAGLQAIVVAAIYLVAIQRRSATVATMATALGFFAAWFSHAAGFDDFALGASMTLLAAAAVFRRTQQWPGPLALAIALHHAMLVWIAVNAWTVAPGNVNEWAAFGYLAGGFAIGFGALIWEGAAGAQQFATAQRWIQIVNVSCASLVGFIVARAVLFENQLAWYFFAGGGVLVLAAVWAWRAAPRDALFSVLAVHAAALLALGAATEWGSRTRWIALLIEAFVILAAARRTSRPSLYVVTVLTWLVALWFLGADIGRVEAQPFSVPGAALAFFALGGGGLLSLVARWNAPAVEGQGSTLPAILALAAAVPVWLTGEHWLGAAWAPSGLILLALMLAGVASVVRNSVPLAGAGLSLVFAHYALQVVRGAGDTTSIVIMNSIAVALGSLGCAGWLVRTTGVVHEPPSNRWQLAVMALIVMGTAALFPIPHALLPWRPALAVTMFLAVIPGAFSWWRQSGYALGASSLALLLAGTLLIWYRTIDATGSVAGTEFWLWIAALAAPVQLILLGGQSAAREELEAIRLYQPASVLAVLVGVVLAVAAATASYGDAGFVWSMLVWVGLYVTIGTTRENGAALAGATVFASLAAFWVASTRAWSEPSLGAALVSGAAAILVAAALPLVARRFASWIDKPQMTCWSLWHSLAAAAASIGLAITPAVPWTSYGSVIWALGGVVIFLFGLSFRIRVHRIVGLLTLALCIPRVFLVDLSSTISRIAAFVVLGVVLLSVGFSYHRFRHLIVDESRDE